MEVYYFICPTCGYVHQVPSYWVNYDKNSDYEQMHMNPKTDEVCPCQNLVFQREEIT